MKTNQIEREISIDANSIGNIVTKALKTTETCKTPKEKSFTNTSRNSLLI